MMSKLKTFFVLLAVASPLALAGCFEDQASAPVDGENQQTGAAPERAPATDG